MGNRNKLKNLLFIAAASLPWMQTSHAHTHLSYVACYGKDTRDHLVWEWAIDESGKYIELNGTWNGEGHEAIFTTSDILEGKLTALCNQSLKKKHSDEVRYSHFRAKSSLILEDYEIGFELNEDRIQELRKLSSSLNSRLDQRFLEIATSIMTSPLYEDLLSGTVNQFITTHVTDLREFLPYLHDAKKYESPPIEWITSTEEDQILEFISKFGTRNDLELLSYEMNLDRGLKRGAFNSYIDLVTDSFKPEGEEKTLKTPGLYDSAQRDHRLTYELVNAFSAFSYLRNTLKTVEKLTQENDTAESFNPDSVNTIYNIYVKEAQHCERSLHAIEEFSYIISPPIKLQIEELRKALSHSVI